MNSLIKKLSEPVDNSPLVVFRIIFGFLITAEAWGAIATGWVKNTFVTPDYTFPFIDFYWLQPLPGNGMYFYFVIMGLAGIMVMLGWRYRAGILIYLFLWTGAYFMQKTSYNNHYYLLLILLFIMSIVPAHHYASLDVKRNIDLKKLTCPRWSLWVFIVQIAIVYFYAAIAKMYVDWIELRPLNIWMDAKKDYFLVGPLLQKEWFRYVIAYGGIAFDLLIVPALLWEKTRKGAFILSIFFHLFNSVVFQVGIFPYLAISWALFFFPPDTIRKIFLKNKPSPDSGVVDHYNNSFKNRRIIYGLAIFMVVQALLPLRHHLFPGNVNWTEEGHRLSWRMMLRTKTGYVNFKVIDNNSGQEWLISPKEYLAADQVKDVATKPDICWQFVQILKEDFAERGYPDIQIYAEGKASYNGRSFQRLYNPAIDLAKEEWQPFGHSKWLIERNDD